MKPFNLELARQGCPVQTRDGKEVRILCFNKKDELYPIVALVNDYTQSDCETVHDYTINGHHADDNTESNYDLVMVTKSHKG